MLHLFAELFTVGSGTEEEAVLGSHFVHCPCCYYRCHRLIHKVLTLMPTAAVTDIVAVIMNCCLL